VETQGKLEIKNSNETKLIFIFSIFFCSVKKLEDHQNSVCFQKTEVTFLNYPGVYEILDTINNFSYYGESECLALRIGRHFTALQKGTHECSKLQFEYTQAANPAAFQFFILEAGPKWINKEKRVNRQDEIIAKNSSRCYKIV
jgi:hypothetical protein